MALSKQITTEYGLMGSYWKITNLAVNIKEMTLSVELSLYAGKFAREMKPLEARTIIIEVSNENLAGNMRVFAYDYIKTSIEEFQTATSV
jgi:hypothetical protein